MNTKIAKNELVKLIAQLKHHIPILIFANKQDLSGALTVDEIADKLDIHDAKHAWRIFPCSAVDGEGLTEGIDWITNRMLHPKTDENLLRAFMSEIPKCPFLDE
eukprot:TRINITY_DN7643_c0_g1_i1.p2 TRINITY_DN7643_c0_g1~~TRINITY_DN7643_c0_g1_i1.p2  ORF type:complete len:104 (-),score=8.12 TRINITY_DN7643_c0_g1_i1:23-334(-)